MTRVSPFFPMSKREMKNRPFEKLSWETSWGRMVISGEKLSVYDETVLLATLLLLKKYKAGTSFTTTRHEVCRVVGVTPAKIQCLLFAQSVLLNAVKI